MLSRFLQVLSIFSAFAGMFSSYGLAQLDTAMLYGRVVDPSGFTIPGVRVELADIDRGTQSVAQTNSAGLYNFPSVRPGHYRLQVSASGFKVVNVAGFLIHPQDSLEYNLALAIGSISESMTVEASTNPLDVSGTVGTVVDQRLVRELPLNGRSFQTLFQLTPGVVIAGTNFSEQGQFSVNGQRTNANYFMVDGVSANIGMANGFGPGQFAGGSLPGATSSGGTNGLVSTDAVQEFAIETSSYAPEFGRTPGAQISVVTRSGTDDFHGTLFDYVRNDAFDANDWLANQKRLKRAALRQNDFGGTVGGPIRKDETFFFASYEGLRLKLPTTGLSDVPTVAIRESAPAPIRPYLQAYPLPTGTDAGNGLAPADYTFSNSNKLDAVSFRVDHHVSNNLSLFGRYNYAPSSITARGGGGTGNALDAITNASFAIRTLTLGSTYVITTNVSNEIRFNLSRSSAVSGSRLDNFGGAIPLEPQTVFPRDVDIKNSEFVFTIASANNSNLIVGPNNNNYQRQFNIVDNLSWQIKTHLLRVGIDYRRLTPSLGGASYVQEPLVNDVQSALAMSASTILQSFAGPVTTTLSNFSWFGQDTWRPRPSLNITYGLRWDYNPSAAVIARNGQRSVAFENTNNPPALSFAPAGTPLYRATKNNFAPRLGIAYQVRHSPTTESLLRAGFGVFYDLGNGPIGNTFALYPFVAVNTTFQPFPLSPAAAAPPLFNSTPPFSLVIAFPSTVKQPYTFQFNLAYEQSLGSKQSLTLGYVGSAGHSLLRQEEFNASPPLPPAFQEVRIVTNRGYSNYNSLQTVFRRRTGKGLEVLALYSLSHSLDNGSSDQAINTPSRFVLSSADYGPSDFDIRHTGSAAVDYELPSPRRSRISNALLGGWAINGLFTVRSSPPVNVTLFRFLSFGLYTLRPDRVTGQPLYIVDPMVPGGRRFNAAALSDPIASTQGDLERNLFRGFPLVQLDFSVRRQFKLTDKIGLQARVEAFNLLNHPNFSPPSGNFGFESTPGQVTIDPAFGKSQGMLNQGLQSSGPGTGFSPLYQIGGPRSLQLALKFEF